MNISQLTKLSPSELRIVSKKNLYFFAIMTSIDLVVFYYSLFMDKWLTMFFSLGFFIACLALYDNYQLTRNLSMSAETAD